VTAGFSALGKVPDAGAPQDDGVGRLVRNRATSGGWGTATTGAFPAGGAQTSSGAVAVGGGSGDRFLEPMETTRGFRRRARTEEAHNGLSWSEEKIRCGFSTCARLRLWLV
jgi:hypothetical protein